MFSYLRPHHKRTSSNPTSPATPGQSFDPQPFPQLDHSHPQRRHDAKVLEQPTRPPPLLPPIARVSSADSGSDVARAKGVERDPRIYGEAGKSNVRPDDALHPSNKNSLPQGLNYRPDSAGALTSTNTETSHLLRQANSANSENASWRTSTNPSGTYAASTDSQPRSVHVARKPTGSRLPTPPPSSSSNFSSYEPAPRSGKTRLNLLNPMSLLARRRTSQAITQLSAESLVSRRSNFSDTFDPRIRGTVVHDFSAPRAPRRNVSYTDVQADKIAGSSSRQTLGVDQNTDDTLGSPWSGGNHTPVFTENFEEEQYPAAGPHVRKASDLTDLPPPQPPYAKGVQKPFDLKSVPDSNDSDKQSDTRRISSQKPIPGLPPLVPPKTDAQHAEPRRISIDTSATPPKKGRSRNVSEVSLKDAMLPKHMKSTSSRFSFDMIGAAEQERLLEDRHRQKALEKKADNRGDDAGIEDEFDDEFDYDDMDDDGLEERIPGVNADLDEEDPYEYSDNIGDLGGFTFQQSSLGSPLSPTSPDMVSTPRDANGEVIGFAMTKNSPYLSRGMIQESLTSINSPESAAVKISGDLSHIQGLGLQGVHFQQEIHPALRSSLPEDTEEVFGQSASLDDDDLYFDDGIIGGPGDDNYVEFDESVFDNIDTDEYGRPLKQILIPLPTLYEPPSVAADSLPSADRIIEHPDEEQDADNFDLPRYSSSSGGLAPQHSVLEKNLVASATHGLTQDTLAAYQSALAAAAFTAAANGKFRRESSPLEVAPSEEENHPGLVTDSSQASHYDTFSPSYELEDDFDYDDALEDDAIIAAANAEALANDCDGFYGQEFGFYSAPAAGVAEYVNGGYFGPRGVEGIGRSQSGRVVSREPNLTPITERSEYSNRNSLMSFSMQGVGSAPSPGLAQLAGMLRNQNEFEGDMSLDALLKLRRGAWGGSQVSLHSSNGSPKSAVDDASPTGQTAPWSQSGPLSSPIANNNTMHRRKNSTLSLASDGAGGAGMHSEVSSAPSSPTMTFAALRGAENSHSPENDTKARPRRHKHTTSAESISYLKEEDPIVGERWILERRRTAESGEIELLGREVVSGGRI